MRYKVWISSHAMEQWRERVGSEMSRTAIAKWVARRIRDNVQSSGLTFNARGACSLELKPGLMAVVALNEWGPGWAVITFTVTGDRLKLPG